MSAKASRRLRSALIAVLVLAALYAAYRYTLHRMVEAKLAEIRKQGYPVTLAELDKWYPQVPQGENAAQVFAQAVKWIHEDTWKTPNERRRLPIAGFARLPSNSEPLSEDMRTTSAKYLADNEEAMMLFRESAAMKSCRYPIDFRQGFSMQVPHLSSLKLAVRMLSLDAVLHADDAQQDQAVNSIISSVHLANSVVTEPLLISQYIRDDCLDSVSLVTQRVITRDNLTDSQLESLNAVFAQVQDPVPMLRALVGERCMAINAFQTMVPADIKFLCCQPWYVPPLFYLYKITGLSILDELCYLDRMDTYIADSKLVLPQRLDAIKMARLRAEKFPIIYFVSRMLVGSGETLLIRDAKTTARLRLACCALAVRRYQIASGSVPDQLDNLVPAYMKSVPFDPFDGQPLRYKKLAKGYVVYSVGEDGKDDGGDEKKDIAFTVER